MNSTLDAMLSGPSLAWLPTITLIYLLAVQPWKIFVPSGTGPQLLAMAILASSTVGAFLADVSLNPWFWSVLTSLYAIWLRFAYHFADNHHFLIAYWSLAITLALWSSPSDGELIISESARLLLGMCFLLATIAKLESKSYRDGSFFTWQLVTDGRFLPLAVAIGGLSAADREKHSAARHRIRSGLSEQEEAPVPSKLWRLAVALTWWTVAVEGLIAILFLLPFPGLAALRVTSLLIFVVTTFSMVNVPAFGQLLLVMLAATVPDADLRWYVLVLACCLFVVSCIPQFAQQLTATMQRARAKPSEPLVR